MKPILLRLSGLQSYREMQEVDFARLCEAGVFGIFGNTGSGKSSILDAVTLALYGKVERAANGTQGIMNQSEKQLSVAFTFELAGGGEQRRYRVERQFKRGGEVSVSNTLSRFIELTDDGEIVHADKLADVTRMVELHIGLSMQDFTRAVVLPQGKFAEFLSLTGKDRRQMLQRLFRLERFGDGLALKLSQRMKVAEAALNEAAAEQLGLGDASDGAIEAASERQQEASVLSGQARSKLTAAEQLHAQQLQIRQRQDELRKVEAKQNALQASSAQVAALEEELKRLAAAEKLIPFLDALQAAEAASVTARQRLAAAEQAYVAAEASEQAAAAQAASAELEAAAAEPRLAQRLEQLAGAQRLEAETQALAAAEQDISARHNQAAEQQRNYAEQALKAEDLLARAQQRQQEVKLELKQTELTADERNTRSLMAKRLMQLQTVQGQLDSARREESSQRAALKQVEDRKMAAQAAVATGMASLRAAANALNPIVQQLSKQEDVLQALLDQLPERMERVKSEYLAQQRLQLAAQLSEGLKAGEPCLVCGSCTHPSPNAGDHEHKGAIAELELEIAGWERLSQHGQQLKFKLATARGKTEHALERLQESLLSADSVSGDQAASASADAAQSYGMLEAAATAELRLASEPRSSVPLSELEAYIRQAREWLVKLENSMTQEENNWSRLRSQVLEARRAADAIAVEQRSLQAVGDAAAAKANELAKQLEEETTVWLEQFHNPFVPEQAQADIDAYEQREKQAEELRGKLDVSVTFIEDKTKARETLRQSEQQARLAMVELGARLEGQRQQLAEKSEQLHAITGGVQTAVLIAASEQELTLLRTKLTALKQASVRAQRLLQQAAEERSAAQEGEKSTKNRGQECRSAWEAALTESPFTGPDDLQQLRPLLKQQATIASQIEQYRKTERELTGQIAMLQEQLDGRSVTDEAWEACIADLAQARAAGEETLQQLAKAQRDLEDLQSKRERWLALEQKRSAMESLCGRLKSLQTVFRGNAFVEYVAEEQLVQVCRAASERLGYLTKRRYALEVDSGGGFVIRDDASGGIRRPVSTLSGGETFLASLALALALSGQIQLRGKYPLQFFFLDEGFGTLDPELLDTVITALEKLQNDKLSVGVISHVPELRARLPRRLIVTAAEPSGRGSLVALETM
ncbi:exonuclease SbcC [Paenibacillus phyllosphaerae]|uniref:Nuclease SbcCD subunit C n=1 Tax=Paenibacillus phyllosphaerae TaxID=274593 RepID=A0A7W5AUL6_9BACL|nr:AAA family ATPase [Paenibacillus phyllosphaerae]MBB3108983.1 exonuclease SbcC [Paenibacillus phyllosphaerae]